MKKLILACGVFLSLFAMPLMSEAFASSSLNSKRVSADGSPKQLVESVHTIANKDFQIQQTKLDGIESRGKYKITSTLEYIRKNIFPYIQWIVFIGLSIGAIMLIWNGFKLVTQSVSGDKVAEIKKDIQSVLIGVVILTSFLIIIRLTLGVLNIFFS
ncbi:MAG: hypothetical protein HXJ92_01300 [candidate division SR1 bacterium]|nr:hypothetical protein [candidate division SR1 bacterium]